MTFAPAVAGAQPAEPGVPEAPAVAGGEAVAEGDVGAEPGRSVPPPPPPSDEATGTEFRQRFVLDTGRIPVRDPDPDGFAAQVHGQYQLRYTRRNDLPLRTAGEATADTLGQNTRMYHWLRITPRLTFGDNLALIGQIDLPRGFIAGEETQFVEPDVEPYDSRDPWQIEPRWLYLEWLSAIGLLRVGQQPSHWGMGILANDGDHPSLFGDYAQGARVERVLFATKPLGRKSPFNVALAADLVFEDNNSSLSDDETALQGVLAVFYQDQQDNMIGFYGVYRHQQREGQSLPGRVFDEELSVWVFDSAGKFNSKLPGMNGHVFGEYEVAYILGDTNFTRTVTQTANNEREDLRQLGAATRVGVVTTEGQGDDRWGDFVAQVEWGWASGDADPYDGTQKRFKFDPNHNVGLLLFDEVLRWKTARAARIAQDQNLSNRPNPGLDLLPSNGGVFGATYLYPTVVVRPVPELDLKAGVVIAQSTADFVDPVVVGTTGRYRNFDNGDPQNHDLGIELDAGAEYRLALHERITLQIGAQGGVLFPGNAFDDEAGNSMDTQYIGVGRLGLQY